MPMKNKTPCFEHGVFVVFWDALAVVLNSSVILVKRLPKLSTKCGRWQGGMFFEYIAEIELVIKAASGCDLSDGEIAVNQ